MIVSDEPPPGLDLARSTHDRDEEQTPLRRMLALVARPGVLSLALGLPAPESLPRQAFAEAAAAVLAEDAMVLQMAPPSEPLRRQIIALMARRGVSCRSEQIFLTAGAQQALYLIGRLFLEPGGEIAADELTYPGLHSALTSLHPRIHPLRCDPAYGTDVDSLASLLRTARPAFVYLMPDGHNPLGVSLATPDRQRLVELASRHGVLLVEDDAYGFLQHEDGAPPLLRALDEEHVISIGSFSKIIGPAMRTGWMIVPERLVSAFSRLKDGIDTDSCTFVQRVLARLFASPSFVDDHLARLRGLYRERRDRMLRALARSVPQAEWLSPRCGLFVWLRLPPGIDTSELLVRAVERERLAFLPGALFGEGDAARRALRLSFSASSLDDLDEGAARLGSLVAGRWGRSGS